MSRKKRAQSRDEAAESPSWLWWVFLPALANRLWHVLAMRGEPFLELELGDAASYARWGREIAAGDWLGSEVFYQAPLYPYFLGAIYRTLGDSVFHVRLVQALLGALGCVFLAAATRRLFSKREALAAGLLLAFYAPAVFFDGWIQKSTLDLFLLCLFLLVLAPLLAKHASPASTGRLVALGALLGALTLSRENALVIAVPVLIWIAWNGRSVVRPALAFVLGMTLVLAPVAIRNYAVGGELVLTTSQLGPNLYIGNNSEADGTYRALRPRRGDAAYERDDATALAEAALGRELSPSEVSDYYVSEVVDFVRTEPFTWLKLTFRKLVLLWSAVEVVDTEDQYSVAEYSAPLRLLGRILHFGTLLPLAVFGIVMTWSERRRLWPLYAMACIYAASVVVFYLFARYRLPLVPFLVVFASAGLLRLRGAKPGAVIAAAVALVLAFLPLVDSGEMRSLTHYNWGTGLSERGEIDGAIVQYRRALALDGNFPMAHNNLGNLYLERGDDELAFEHLSRAVSLDESFEEARNNVGNLLIERGDPVGAEEHLEAAIRIRPDYAEAYNGLGNALSMQSKGGRAREAYERALELRPDYALAHHNLGTLLFEQGELGGAERHLRESLRLDESNPESWNNLGIVHAVRGELAQAEASFRRALTLDPRYQEARDNLARAQRAQE